MKPGRLSILPALLALIVFAQSAVAADPINVQIMALDETPGSMQITVSAVDGAGRPLPNMTADNFRVGLGNTQLDVKELLAPDASRQPASVLLLVDVSGSMYGDSINQARNAIGDFVQTLEPTDQVAIMAFSEKVSLLQDFTADRTLLSSAISRLQATGNTALYDAVIAGSDEITKAPPGRRLVVVLSDGEATLGLDKKAASIASANAAGVSYVAVGLGAKVDTQYLTSLTGATGGRLLEAATPAAMRQAYSDLAQAIRSQYTLLVTVPATVDRTVPGDLRVHATYNADNSFAERQLGPLPGALPPAFPVGLQGVAPGQKLQAPVALAPASPNGGQLVKVEYYVDGQLVHTSEGDSLAYTFDPGAFSPGEHQLTVRATDAAGKPGIADLPFIVVRPAAASGGMSLPLIPILALAAAAAVAMLLLKLIKKRRNTPATYVSTRITPWSERGRAASRDEEEPAQEARPRGVPLPRAAELQAVGRVVIMNENAVRNGQLDGIQEYPIFASPLTFGTGAGADVRVTDPTGAIAAEEARLWVQRGRLVYHKLTTLSAMATEGVTEGWQFLDGGEDLRIGVYRLVFQLQTEEPEQAPVAPQPSSLPQEHGMSLQHSWEMMGKQRSDNQFPDSSLAAEPAADPFNREETTPHDSTAFEGEGDYRSA